MQIVGSHQHPLVSYNTLLVLSENYCFTYYTSFLLLITSAAKINCFGSAKNAAKSKKKSMSKSEKSAVAAELSHLRQEKQASLEQELRMRKVRLNFLNYMLLCQLNSICWWR